MLPTILRSVVRQARRHPLYVALNVLGLGLGIGVFLILALLVRYEYSYNATIPDVAHIVRIDEHVTEPGTAPSESADTTFHALPFLRQDFPQIHDAVRLVGTTLRVTRDGHDTAFDGYATDPSFFNVFALPLLNGNSADALARPDAAILSQRTAMTLFGSVDVVGRTIEMNRAGTKSLYTITGVLKLPDGPSFLRDDAEILIRISPQEEKNRSCFLRWGSSCGETYLRVNQQADIADINGRLRDFVARRAAGPDNDPIAWGANPEKTLGFSLHPLTTTRFHDMGVQDIEDGADRNVVNSIGLIGLLALGLACANAINLASARAVLRAREVAVRKTLGASRQQLFVQFMGEACVLIVVSAILGLALCELLMPEVASLMGEAVRVDYRFVLPVLGGLVPVCTFAAGFYPATVLSGYRPAAVLAATRMPSGGRNAARLRNVLVAAQFAIAICIVICTLVISRQTAFLRNADQGYAKSGLLIGNQLRTEDIARQRRMLDALRAVPGVTAAGFGELEPHAPSLHNSTYSWASPHGMLEVQLLGDRVGAGYFEAYRPRLLAGRWFDPARGQDEGVSKASIKAGVTTYNVVINAKAVAAFGFASPADALDKIVSTEEVKARIVGVTDDIRFLSPRDPVKPQITYFNALTAAPFDDPIPAVRYAGVTRAVMAERLNRAWRALEPDQPGDFVAADDRMATYYSGDEKRGRLFSFGAAAALVIACLGLYGLASFSAARRVHEIGIRKTLGATGRQIIVLLLGDFLRPVVIACLLACPVAWMAMRAWLSAFDERIPLTSSLFLMACASALLIAACTVIGQTLSLARAEPARALRAE
ncbi:ABC transporter permease [Brytella acorum]|uniref:ABC transporter permease n=1 Tax=Brytella acorum TaxID=2959299 RepID=A0AA35VA08_9PROT|nr:ABC transporter permease [Brytella acorum]MDF3623385.1 ABC transporter permease [Brytella acorum]CAI9120491.1 ABC transporter permease [Brytella acorum]